MAASIPRSGTDTHGALGSSAWPCSSTTSKTFVSSTNLTFGSSSSSDEDLLRVARRFRGCKGHHRQAGRRVAHASRNRGRVAGGRRPVGDHHRQSPRSETAPEVAHPALDPPGGPWRPYRADHRRSAKCGAWL